jgi:2-polyprenyl-6-methoxyphenol hydroxylase-like FAD-dependent oxidoreductase
LTRTALIVGAGIGGLSAAIALRRAGWNVRIFERSASPRELGFGLALAPNAIAALHELGVADAVTARGFEPRLAEVRRLDGTLLRRIDMPTGAFGGPMVIALRSALHGALLDAVGPDAISPGVAAAGFTVTDDGVALRLADGTVVEGTLLVGADGVNSAIRHVLHPEEPPPRPADMVAVRGAVHGALGHLGDLHAVYYLGPGVEALLIRASSTGIYWFLSVSSALVPPDRREPASMLAMMASRFDATFNAVTTATDDLRSDELFDRDPIPFWGRGRVTLLGDAAHPVLPHTGQGAAQAIVDAVTLGKAVSGAVDVDRALRGYEGERRSKTARLLKQGRRTARVMQTTDPTACYLREAVVRLAPIRSFMKFFAAINRRAGTMS